MPKKYNYTMKTGRPTKYDPSMVAAADDYLQTTGREQQHLPKIVSFALYLGVNEETVYAWAKKYPDFSKSLAKIKERQLQQLTDDGIYGGKEVNASIVKLIMSHNHGYREKSDITTDGQPLPQPIYGAKAE